jgi:hypothetical protein
MEGFNMKKAGTWAVITIAGLVLFFLMYSLHVEAQNKRFSRRFHIHQLSQTDFIVTCDENADPTVKGTSETKNEVQISCGQYK